MSGVRYYVSIAGRTVEVELDGETARVDGREARVELETVAGPVRHLLMNGRSFPVVAEAGEGKGSWSVTLRGHRFAAEVLDERTRAIRGLAGRAGAAHGPLPIRAPMPGLVTRVEVEVGHQVAPGQGLVIVEAMKMENELKAELAGVVSRVLVAAGQAVEKGAVLIEFAAAPE